MRGLNRAVGSVGKGKHFIGLSVPLKPVQNIDSRAKALGWTRARYTLAIVEKWYAEGCPPVSEADNALQVLAGKSASKKSA